MSTEKQREANRRNAQRSTGPRTPEGKERSRLNAVTHGLRSEFLDVIPGEDREAFAARLDRWREEHRPATGAQDHLVRQAVILSWKIDRIERYEVALVWDRVHEAIMPRLDGPIEDAKSLESDFLKVAALASFDASNEGERLRRYQLSLQRALLRILDTLAKLRAQDARVKAAEAKVDANEAYPPEDRPELSANEANSPRPSASRADLFDAIEANSRPLRPVSTSVTPKRPVRLDLLDGPSGAPCTPWYEISCEKP